jgi:hypothetical protein
VSKDELDDSAKPMVGISNRIKNISGTVQKLKLSNEIRINLKTLYGERRMHSYNVKIDERISNLIKLLTEDEEKLNNTDEKKKWSKRSQYRLISTVGTIRELVPFKTFYEEGIKNGQILILANPIKLTLSETKKGPGIVIQNNCNTALKQSGEELQYVLSNRGYSSGSNYCEFTLEAEPDERNILIGVSTDRSDFYFSNDCKGFWGYVPSE